MRPVLRKNAYGVTLVELMITLVVAAILVALATPSFRDFIDKSRLKGVADGVVNVINDARTQSVKQGRGVMVKFSGTTAAWCVGANAASDPNTPGDPMPAPGDCDCTSSTACMIGGQREAFDTGDSKGVTLSALPTHFAFDSRLGTIQGLTPPAAVTLTSPQQRFSLQLTMTPLGQANLCVPSGSRVIVGYPSC